MEGPPVWDSTFVSRPGEYVCTSVLLSAFPDTSTRRVKTSLAGGELWGGGRVETEELSVQEAALPVPKPWGHGGGDGLFQSLSQAPQPPWGSSYMPER